MVRSSSSVHCTCPEGALGAVYDDWHAHVVDGVDCAMRAYGLELFTVHLSSSLAWRSVFRKCTSCASSEFI